jgi:hypothetical protein
VLGLVGKRRLLGNAAADAIFGFPVVEWENWIVPLKDPDFEKKPLDSVLEK